MWQVVEVEEHQEKVRNVGVEVSVAMAPVPSLELWGQKAKGGWGAGGPARLKGLAVMGTEGVGRTLGLPQRWRARSILEGTSGKEES